jgi:hypothetical protein
MKNRELFKRFATILSVVAVIALIVTTVLAAQTQKPNADKLTEQGKGGGLGTGLISLAPGQSVRVSAVNVGNKTIPVELIFVPVNEKGEYSVPIPCNAISSPGNAVFDKFTHPGGANRIDFYAQVRVEENAGDLDELVPSLQIIDDLTGETLQLLSGADFASFRPIWVPS